MADNPNPASAEIAREANACILALDASLYEMTVHALGPRRRFCTPLNESYGSFSLRRRRGAVRPCLG